MAPTEIAVISRPALPIAPTEIAVISRPALPIAPTEIAVISRPALPIAPTEIAVGAASRGDFLILRKSIAAGRGSYRDIE